MPKSKLVALDALLAAEARGDSSNLKGTDYHLLYAVWLLITNRAKTIQFYEGNDLLALPISPPVNSVDDDKSDFLMATTAGDQDVWIQLKCTQTPWTCSKVLSDTLVKTFVANSFLSDSRKHSWRVSLVTTSEIRCEDILSFVANPAASPELLKKLDGIVTEVIGVMAAQEGVLEPGRVRARALEIVDAIARCQPVARRTLYAETLAELAFLVSDRQIAHEIQRQLMGSLLQTTAGEATRAVVFDRAWIHRFVGRDPLAELPLDISAVAACEAQVNSRLPEAFAPNEYVSREVERGLLEDFRRSTATALVIGGRSGTGKSWTAASWATKETKASLRLLIPGRLLTVGKTLIQLVADEVRPFTAAIQSDQLLFHRICNPSWTATFGPLMLFIDDIRAVHGQTLAFAQTVAALVDDARKYRIRLVFVSQTDVLRTQRILSQVKSTDVFQSDRRDNEVNVNSGDGALSCTMNDFSDDELRSIVGRFTDSLTREVVLLQLRDPSFSSLRNPYTLNVFFSTVDEIDRISGLSGEMANIAAIFEKHIDRIIETVQSVCGMEVVDIAQTLDFVVTVMWDCVDGGVSHLELRQRVESRFSSMGREIFDAFFSAGVLERSPLVRFCDAKIATRLFARSLAARYHEPNTIIAQLNVERDHDITAQLCILSANPTSLATSLVDSDVAWIPAVSEGLAQCDPNDRSIGSCLVVFARRERRGATATESFGRFAIRTPKGQSELLKLFVSSEGNDRQFAERALWYVGKFVPDLAIKAVRMRFRLRGKAPSDAEKRHQWRRGLARALQVISGFDSKYATMQARSLIQSVSALAEDALSVKSVEQQFRFVAGDRLLRAYDQMRILAAYYSDDTSFDELFLQAAHADDVYRGRSVNALDLVGRRFPVRLKDAMCKAIGAETNPLLLARILWNAFHLCDIDADGLLGAIESNISSCWATYESAAATLGLLEVLAARDPSRVLSLLPGSWSSFPKEIELLLREIDLVCRFRCRSVAASSDMVAAIASSEAEIAMLEPENVFYARRAQMVAAVLELSRACRMSSLPEVWRYEIRDYGQDLFHLDIAGWIEENQEAIEAFADTTTIASIVLLMIQAGHNHQPHVLDKWRKNAHFRLACDSLDVLVILLQKHPKPETLVGDLPSDWQLLFVARRLLESGIARPELVDLAVIECEKRSKSATGQGACERDACLAVLERIAPAKVPSIDLEPSGFGRLFFGQQPVGIRLASQLTSSEEKLVESLESSIERFSDATLLEPWNRSATTWRTELLSRSYSRMCLLRPICPKSAMELCNSALVALSGIPRSAARDEHVALYESIVQSLERRSRLSQRLNIRTVRTAVTESHRLAVEILQMADKSYGRSEIRQKLFDNRGWREDDQHGWNDDGTIKAGMGISYYLLIFFPAVRLSLCAAGSRCDWYDPGFTWMRERWRATIVAQEVGHNLEYADRAKSRARLEAELELSPEQPKLHAVLGHLSMLDARFDDALQSLKIALASPLCDNPMRGEVLYNMACAHARMGSEDACRRSLLESKQFTRIDLKAIEEDSDFDNVREADWFRALINSDGPLQ